MFTQKSLTEKGRHRLYLILDTETATLPLANEIALNETQKKNIAIAKPLVYDIGWQIVDSKMNIYSKHSYLVVETFAVPSIFNTAYYKEKRPLYLAKLAKNEISIKPWNEITQILFDDLREINYAGAYNAMFDFKKAIPFTEQYIYHLYNSDYSEWETRQRAQCENIAKGYKSNSERDFDRNNFNFKGIDFPIIDLWGIACQCLINNQTYKRNCIKNQDITESGKFFKTSAESVYRYLINDNTFIEAHTAIEDVEIESFILYKALQRGKIPIGIIHFPFNILGTVPEFLQEHQTGVKKEHFNYVIQIMEEKRSSYVFNNSFKSSLENMINTLCIIRDERF